MSPAGRDKPLLTLRRAQRKYLRQKSEIPLAGGKGQFRLRLLTSFTRKNKKTRIIYAYCICIFTERHMYACDMFARL